MQKGKRYRKGLWKINMYFHSGFLASLLGFFALLSISAEEVISSSISCYYNIGHKAIDITAVVIFTTSFIVSLVGTIKSIIRLWHECFRRQIIKDNDYKSEIIRSVTIDNNSDYNNNRYEWNDYNGELYLHSDEVNNALSERANQLFLQVSPKKKAMSKDQRNLLYQIVNDKISQGKIIFNSNLVSLRTDMFIDAVLSTKNNIQEVNKQYKEEHSNGKKSMFADLTLVNVEKTDYFLNLTTNDLIYDKFFDYDYSSISCGKDMLVDSRNHLYNLSQSPAANIIGVNTLAITSDHYAIINRQNRNDVHNNTYVPSGSGSSDFSDLKACRKLEAYIKKAEKINKSQSAETLPLYEKTDDISLLYKNNQKSLRYEERHRKDLKSKRKNDPSIDMLQELITTKENLDEKLKNKTTLKKYIKKMKKHTYDFKNFLSYGMVRELIEESYICNPKKIKKAQNLIIQCIDSTYICGFIRLLDRGGKPDFFGITLLNLSKEDVKKSFNHYRRDIAQKELLKNCPITDYNEVCSQQYILISDLKNCKNIEDLEHLLNKDNDADHCAKVSLQLAYLFNLLKKDNVYKKVMESRNQ